MVGAVKVIGVCRIQSNLQLALLLPNAAGRAVSHRAHGQPSMPDDHSPLEPPLPIPNRTVKRWHADDSVDYPCESRSSSGTLKTESPASRRAFCFCSASDRPASAALTAKQVKAYGGGRSHRSSHFSACRARAPSAPTAAPRRASPRASPPTPPEAPRPLPKPGAKCRRIRTSYRRAQGRENRTPASA